MVGTVICKLNIDNCLVFLWDFYLTNTLFILLLIVWRVLLFIFIFIKFFFIFILINLNRLIWNTHNKKFEILKTFFISLYLFFRILNLTILMTFRFWLIHDYFLFTDRFQVISLFLYGSLSFSRNSCKRLFDLRMSISIYFLFDLRCDMLMKNLSLQWYIVCFLKSFLSFGYDIN